MNGMDSYLVLSTESDAYILGSVVNDGWYRLGEDGRPLGRALSYQEIDRHWVSLDYSRSWDDARRSLERRQRAISGIDSRRHRSTGSLKICYVPTITIGTFMEIVRAVEDNTGVDVRDMTFGTRALVVDGVCDEGYQTTGCAIAELVSPDCVTDISWTGSVVG